MYVEKTRMTGEVEFFEVIAEMGFERLDEATIDLKEKELDWQPLEEANSIRWILTHISELSNGYIPKVFLRDYEFTPEEWPNDYVGNRSYSLEEILEDLEKGKEILRGGLRKLSPADLEVRFPHPSGMRKMSWALMHYIRGIIHHVGQLAYLKGTIRRRREKNEQILT